MWDDNSLGISYPVEDDWPEERKQYASQSANRTAALALWEYLRKPENKDAHIVISIRDEEQPYSTYPYRITEHRIYVDVSKALEQHITIPVAHFETMGWVRLSTTAVDEIKRRVTRKIRGLFHHK